MAPVTVPVTVKIASKDVGTVKITDDNGDGKIEPSEIDSTEASALRAQIAKFIRQGKDVQEINILLSYTSGRATISPSLGALLGATAGAKLTGTKLTRPPPRPSGGGGGGGGAGRGPAPVGTGDTEVTVTLPDGKTVTLKGKFEDKDGESGITNWDELQGVLDDKALNGKLSGNVSGALGRAIKAVQQGNDISEEDAKILDAIKIKVGAGGDQSLADLVRISFGYKAEGKSGSDGTSSEPTSSSPSADAASLFNPTGGSTPYTSWNYGDGSEPRDWPWKLDQVSDFNYAVADLVYSVDNLAWSIDSLLTSIIGDAWRRMDDAKKSQRLLWLAKLAAALGRVGLAQDLAAIASGFNQIDAKEGTNRHRRNLRPERDNTSRQLVAAMEREASKGGRIEALQAQAAYRRAEVQDLETRIARMDPKKDKAGIDAALGRLRELAEINRREGMAIAELNESRGRDSADIARLREKLTATERNEEVLASAERSIDDRIRGVGQEVTSNDNDIRSSVYAQWGSGG